MAVATDDQSRSYRLRNLDDLGIKKDQASRWPKLAVSQRRFGLGRFDGAVDLHLQELQPVNQQTYTLV
jgi:hypothetical protein